MSKDSEKVSVIAKFAGVVVPVLFIIASLILNTAYREALFLMGLNEIDTMQANGSGFLNFLENIFSLLANPIIVVIVLVVELVVVKQRIRSLVHIIFITGAFFYVAAIKQTIQESRPFWFSPNIQIHEWFCPTDFGNPSGHSFIVVLAYEPILSDFVGTGPRKVLIGVWVIFSALVLLSRMYLGSHSLDQIIFGCLLGLAFLIIYKYQFQKMLYGAVTNVFSQKNRTLYLIINTVILVVFLGLPIIEYLINHSNRPIDGAEITNINLKCSKNQTSDSLQEKNLKGTALGCVAVGLFYGLVLLENTHNEDALYLVGKWSYRQKKNIAFLIVAIVLIAVIPGGLLALLVPAVSNIAILNFLCVSAGALWASFALVYPLCRIQNKYRWISYDQRSIE